jgi:hypothetical protein
MPPYEPKTAKEYFAFQRLKNAAELLAETGDRRDVPRFFDEWKLVNVPSVPSFSR